MDLPLLTVGHGTLPADAFVELLLGAHVDALVDIRRFPGSRRHPQFGRDQLAATLADAGISYRWEERLGGRRRGAPDSPHVAMRNASFRAYADWMGSATWRAAVEELLGQPGTVVVMCSESVWWRCHRRLVADALTLLHELPVRHLMHDGRLVDHAVTDAARVTPNGITYDVT